jgi:hypothetical protein
VVHRSDPAQVGVSEDRFVGTEFLGSGLLFIATVDMAPQ